MLGAVAAVLESGIVHNKGYGTENNLAGPAKSVLTNFTIRIDPVKAGTRNCEYANPIVVPLRDSRK
jgi:hypothetical protein